MTQFSGGTLSHAGTTSLHNQPAHSGRHAPHPRTRPASATGHRTALCCELATEVARRSGQVRIRLLGTSMVPSLWPGDEVVVRRCSAGELRAGDVVVFTSNGVLTAHRLLHKDGGLLLSQGDSLPRLDPPVPASGIIGCVVAVKRKGRSVSLRRRLLHRVVSSLIRRSEVCTHLTLRLGSSVWSLLGREEGEQDEGAALAHAA